MTTTLSNTDREALHHLTRSPAMRAHLGYALATARNAGDVTARFVAQYLAYAVRGDAAIDTAVKVALAGAGPAAQHLVLAWLAQHPGWTCDRPDPGPDVRWTETNPY